MITFEYDNDGNLLTYKDGKLVGSVVTMGDLIKKEPEAENKREQGSKIKRPQI